ncbi:lipid A biosynthesis acyltransferase [Dokdonia sinensis]|uniref:Lipid A biosynthesis acyltransferase n=1 Tax=Dokdonia sinensis TaxID=2479847 RepID=A0A3M0G5Z8_9FLAO|nr:lysophospholipid acyltransferase family protein [Dokdonia sinensis]RMB59517.1 lipid A biosynthesis acyltransferase [Dokdonia sinensis]
MKAVVFWIFYPLLWLLSVLPFRLLYIISDCCYFLIYRVIGYRKKTVRYNLRTSFPEKSEAELKSIERKFYSHLCDMFLEMIKSMNIKKKDLLERYQFANVEAITDYDQADQSTCLIMGHYASYEWVFALQLYVKHPGYAIYKKIKHKQFDNLIRDIRGRWNTFMVDSKEAMRTIQKLESEGKTGCYGFVADQSPRFHRAKYWTQFLGHELPFFTGVERIAQEFDLPVRYLGVEKVKRGYYVGTFQSLTTNGSQTEEGEITSAFAKALETQIRNRPEFYLWTHKRFKLLGKKEEVLAEIEARRNRNHT